MRQNQEFYVKSLVFQIEYILNLIKQIRSDTSSLNVEIFVKFIQNKIYSKIHGNNFDQLYIIFHEINQIYSKKLNDLDEDSYSNQSSYQPLTMDQILGTNKHFKNSFDNFLTNNQQMKIHESYLNDDKEQTPNARGPYRSYTLQEKQKIVQLYKQGYNYAKISRILKIPQKNIVRWCKNGVIRKKGAGRKVGDQNMELNILKWIQNNFIKGQSISINQIRNIAKKYSTKQQFKSSKGWLKNFIKRHKIDQKYYLE